MAGPCIFLIINIAIIHNDKESILTLNHLSEYFRGARQEEHKIAVEREQMVKLDRFSGTDAAGKTTRMLQ